MDTGYIRSANDATTMLRRRRTSADLACWTALVHAWDDIEEALGEAIAIPSLGAGEKAERPAGLGDVRPFG